MATINHLQGYAFAKKKGDRIDVFEGPHTLADFMPVIAEGTDVPRMLKDRFADVVNVRDFGAKGDGVTDDTEAIQAAVTSNKSIFFPAGRYRCTESITVPDMGATTRRTFYGASFPYSNEVDQDTHSCVVFENEGIGFNIQSAMIELRWLGISGTESTRNNFNAVRFKRLYNVDDMDGFVTECQFSNTVKAVQFWGRALNGYRNLFTSTCVCFELCWDFEGDQGQNSDTQNPPYGNRALRIIGNRKHGAGSFGNELTALVKNSGDVLRGAIISDNLLDIGGVLLRDSKGLDSCLITNNVCDIGGAGVTSCPIMSSGAIYNTIISHNVFSCKYSKVPNEVSTSGAAFGLSFTGTIDGITISNNLIQGWTIRGITLNREVSENKTYKNITISNNIFDCSNSGNQFGTSGIGVNCRVEGLTVIGNVLCGTPAVEGFQGFIWQNTSTETGSIISGVTVLGNELNGKPVFQSLARLQNINVIQDSDNRFLFFTNSRSGALSIGNKLENSQIVNFENLSLDYQRLGFTSSTSKVYLGVTATGSLAEFWASSDDVSNVSLGRPASLWSEVYATTGTINTSDYRLKQNIANPTDALLNAWGSVGFKVFQFKDAVEKKGLSAARYHVGVIAQDVQNAFTNQGLDATKYGLFCHDEWGNEYETVEVIDQEEVLDAEGNVVTPVQKHTEQRVVTAAGDRFGIRYEEALALECAYLRRELDRIKTALVEHGITL